MSKSVIIVGSGIVGIATAATLRQQGHDVLLIDQVAPAKSTSYGNAGAFAVTETLPHSDLHTLRKVPGWILRKDSPLSIDYKYLPKLAPWLGQFVRSGFPKRGEVIANSLAALLKNCVSDVAQLLVGYDLSAETLLHKSGAITLYDSASTFASETEKWKVKAKLGFHYQEVDAAFMQQYFPTLTPTYQQGVFTKEWAYVDDPYLFSTALFDAAAAKGVQFLQQEVSQLILENTQVKGVKTIDGKHHLADYVVVASGVWSSKFARQEGIRLPLTTERGYHVTLPHANVEMKKFLISADHGFVILPMGNGAIRLAGTVELTKLGASPNWYRSGILLEKAKQIVGDFDSNHAAFWMGNRPALADTVPVISRSPRYANLVYAFGHGHLGLTLSATTGKLVQQLINEPTSSPHIPYIDIRRFQ